MGDVRKAFKPGTTERMFDRLTVLILSHELLLNGTYGPVTPDQKKVLNAMIAQSRDVAAMLREMTDL